MTVTGSIRELAPGKRLPAKVRGLIFLRDQGLLVLWIAIIVAFSFSAAPYFFTMATGIATLNSASIAAIYAAGLAVGVMTGSLDLSVPGTAALAGVVTALLLGAGTPVWPAVLAGLATGPLVGIVNGLVVIRGFDPLIVTIAMLSVLSGTSLVLSGGENVSTGLTALSFLGTQTYAWIPAPVYLAAALFLVLTAFLKKTRAGLRMLAVGGNGEAARRVGVPMNRYRILGFAISGLCAALGGIVTSAYTATASPTASVDIVFSAMTAVALAGIPFSGGRGSLPRVALGAVVIATISTGLLLAGVQTYWSSIVTGFLLVGGLALNLWTTRRATTLLLTTDTGKRVGE
jgi:ribose transport system permease protein